MKTTKRKASGFFIVEILIVLAIIAILVTALLPNLSTYTKKAKFVDVMSAAEAVKSSVELCMLQDPNNAATNCSGGQNGVPANNANDAGNLSDISTSGGLITAQGTAAVDSATFTLTPTYNTASNTITWAKGGTCSTLGLC